MSFLRMGMAQSQAGSRQNIKVNAALTLIFQVKLQSIPIPIPISMSTALTLIFQVELQSIPAEPKLWSAAACAQRFPRTIIPHHQVLSFFQPNFEAYFPQRVWFIALYAQSSVQRAKLERADHQNQGKVQVLLLTLTKIFGLNLDPNHDQGKVEVLFLISIKNLDLTSRSTLKNIWHWRSSH